MGCDGGTIPRRDELVRVKKKPEQVIICALPDEGGHVLECKIALNQLLHQLLQKPSIILKCSV